MRFSRSFKASAHCLPSPNGRLVATLLPSQISVRGVESLQTAKEIRLPRDFTGPVVSFQWSPSSSLILAASADQIHVFSASHGNLHATIRNPVPPAARPVFVGFAPSDAEVCVCDSLGLKLAVFSLASSRAVEVANPKFHGAATACRGFSFRPRTRHLAVLTRTAGRDAVSIHHPATRELQRSWYPDTADAQGLAWSPTGAWLATWEAPGHGHRVLFYTPDGNLYKAWSGPHSFPADADAKLGAGVRLAEFSADGRYLAVGDYSRRVSLLGLPDAVESVRLQHPSSIAPAETLQVWQEQFSPSDGHTFVRATQTIFPPAGQPSSSSSAAGTAARSGCTALAFDSSSELLATRLEDSPGTIWIWDVAAAELRAVLVFHASVSRVSWHPAIRETLLISCDGDAHGGLAFVWDPLSEGPRPVDFSARLLAQKGGAAGNNRSVASWLNLEGVEPGALFASNGRDYVLASLVDSEDEAVPWLADGEGGGLPSAGLGEESPFGAQTRVIMDEAALDDDYEASDIDDTFSFKRA